MDHLSVPPVNNSIVDERAFSDLYVRTSWFDAALALDQIEKGKASGRRSSVYMRSVFQSHLFTLGCAIQKHAGKVLFVAILVLCTFCVALKSATVHSKVHQLWIQEGGRLEEELKYTQKSLGEMDSSTHQLLIQTPNDEDATILHPQALLTHLEVVKQAISVTVHMFDITWSLKDMCYSPNIPNFDTHYIEQIFENVIPCAIITPLDCFWEGSKLLGPEFPVHIPVLSAKLQWTSLNPQQVLKTFKTQNYPFPFDTLEQYMKRAGISTGYTEKPCLNPKDPLCPDTAENKKSQMPPDVAAALTGGCYGFAAKYMHWPEELIVGGVTRNRSSHLKKAKALQTVVQLMGEREMFEFWSDHYKVHHIGWSPEKASEILNAWQKKFSIEVHKIMHSKSAPTSYEVYAFSSAALDEILGKFSNPNPICLGIGIFAILIYTAAVLYRYDDPVNGQSCVGVFGVILLTITTIAGLGFCALLGIPFNAATTQVVPFLALGLGVDHIFIVLNAYASSSIHEQTGHVLKKASLSILFSGTSTSGSFFAAAIIPVPALRVFCLQIAILLTFNLISILLIYPAMISLDLRRRKSGRADILCCCLPDTNKQPYHQPNKNNFHQKKIINDNDEQSSEFLECSERNCFSLSITHFSGKYYAPFLAKSSVKAFSVILLTFIVGISAFAALKITDGLELTDLVPQNTDEHKFLSVQGKLFGFYNMFAVTQGDFEYPNNQKILYEYHEAFVRVSNIIKNDNGGLPEFWLSLFRDWLQNLQKSFDRDYREGRITQERWYKNASDEAILAYKLLVQTGHVDNPIDKTLVSQVRLVDADNIINPKAFYNYLSAWAWNDGLAYGASQANLRPEPREWFHAPSDFELKIPKSAPLTYTQLPFYLHGLSDTSDIKNLIGQIREICYKFEEKGLPNYPSGILFLFWEQYMSLRMYLVMALGCAISAALVLVGILLLSVWAAVLVVLSVLTMLIQLLGMMALLEIKLSAIPAVILVASVGIGICFSVHITLSFITAIGNCDRRMRLALEHSLAPVLHGVITSTLAILMLSTSSFEFVVRHFFWLLLSVMSIGAVNGLFFFPILISLIGPSAEVIPFTDPNRISTPSPPLRRAQKCYKKTNNTNRRTTKPLSTSRSTINKSHHNYKYYNNNNNNTNNEPSLTTITEEPSWKSSVSSISSVGNNHTPTTQSIVLQPEVNLEVETRNTGRDVLNTRVTATANIKLELINLPLRSTRTTSKNSECSSSGSNSS